MVWGDFGETFRVRAGRPPVKLEGDETNHPTGQRAEALADDSADGRESAHPSGGIFGETFRRAAESGTVVDFGGLYGIAARQSVHLSEICRALEKPIPLIKTENRLSRNLGRPELRSHIGANVLCDWHLPFAL